MKHILLALIATIISTQLYSTTVVEPPRTSESVSSVVLAETQSDVLPKEEKAKETVKSSLSDPNNCEPKQYWAKDPPHECIDKPKVAPASARPAGVSGDCESYRPLVSKYGWNVDIALFVMYRESECRYDAVSPTNDYGLFQLNNQAVFDPEQNIAIAWDKYVGGRVGSNNWSAWYAVCTPGNDPQPKYAGVHCQ